MGLREAAEALLDDYDSIELEDGSYKVAWPEMEALRDALAEAEATRDDAEHFRRVVSQLGKAACRVDDLVILCKRLSRALKSHNPGHPLHIETADYLRREGLTGSPLRAEAEAPKAEPVTLPRVYGVGRDAEYPRALLVDFDRVPTDDELRALHELVRSPPAPQPVESAEAELSAEEIINL